MTLQITFLLWFKVFGGVQLYSYCLFFLGGGIGANLRYFLLHLIHSLGFTSHIAIAFINIFGSFIMGLFVGILILFPSVNEKWQCFLLTGVLGAFTTFSAFSAENYQLFQQKAYLILLLQVVLQPIIGIMGFYLGYSISCGR